MILSVLALLVLLAGVIWLVSSPLRSREPGKDGLPEGPSSDQAALEAAKEAKYAEIRDAELDLQMGKLSEQDFRALDRQLRAEAVEILHALDVED